MFKIVFETSVASGVRRIEAVTGLGVIEAINNANALIEKAASALKISNASALVQRCEAVQNEIHDLNKEIDRLNRAISASQMQNIFDNMEEVKGVKLITAVLEGATGDNLKKAADDIKSKQTDFIAVLAGHADGKGNFLCVCSKEAVAKGANAGQIVRRIAEVTGAKGGGKPDMAMSGIGDLAKINEALASLKAVAEEILK